MAQYAEIHGDRVWGVYAYDGETLPDYAPEDWLAVDVTGQDVRGGDAYDPATGAIGQTWETVRERRDAQLRASDWTQVQDYAAFGLTSEQVTAWADHRQALRDLPQTYADPAAVVFPDPPA